MISADYEKVLLAIMAWREASGEGQNGMLAVMNVAMNRSRDWKIPVWKVITAQNEFSSISVHSDPETTRWPAANDPAFVFCLQRSDAIYTGRDVDITLGAHYYYNPRTADSPWFTKNIVDAVDEAGQKVHPITATIGNHIFFK